VVLEQTVKDFKICVSFIDLYDAETWDTLESGSEIPGKLWNAVLEKDGEDQLDRPCEKWRNITKSRAGEEYPTNNKKKEW